MVRKEWGDRGFSQLLEPVCVGKSAAEPGRRFYGQRNLKQTWSRQVATVGFLHDSCHEYAPRPQCPGHAFAQLEGTRLAMTESSKADKNSGK